MKKHFLLLPTLLLGLSLTACSGKKGDATPSSLDSSAINAANEKPYADSELQNSDTVKISGKTYIVSVHRKADASLPTLKDEYGKVFYDNRVDIKITCDGEVCYEKSYTKEDFAKFLSSDEKHNNLLLGMAYDRTRNDAHTIYLGAQIGQIGIEEGPAFCIEVPISGGEAKISREANQDTTGEDGLGD